MLCARQAWPRAWKRRRRAWVSKAEMWWDGQVRGRICVCRPAPLFSILQFGFVDVTGRG